MVKFPVMPTAAMFIPMAWDTASEEAYITKASGREDCVIYCHEDPWCGAVIYGSQPDSHGNNCYLFQKRRADLNFLPVA